MILKTPRQRNQHLLDMAQGKPCLFMAVESCQLDYGQTTVAAHQNEGKGKSRKQDDHKTVWGCVNCHTWYDQSGAPLAEKRRAFEAAYERQKQAWREIVSNMTAKPKDRAAAMWALGMISPGA